MLGFFARLIRATVCTGCVAAAMLPLAAHATEITFDWVPTSESPPQTNTGSGSITLDFSSWGLTGTSNPPNFGPYYSSGSAITTTITAFSYTAADGQTADLADLSTTTLGAPTQQTAQIWNTSGFDTPAAGPQSPSAPTAGYYLVTPFSVSGDTASGTPFMIANNTGVAGATYANGIGSGDATFNADGAIPATEDGGYWEVAPAVAPVPLPAGLPMLLGGLTMLGWMVRRRPTVADRACPSPAI